MKRVRSVTVLVLLLGLVVLCGHHLWSQDTTNQGGPHELVGLAKELRDTLNQLFEAEKRQYLEGLTSINAVAAAKSQLVDAELETAATSNDRLKLLDDAVNEIRHFEETVGKMAQNGVANVNDHLRIKALRLKYQLILARETAGGK